MVLVHDEAGLYEQDLDGRLGFINPLGLDVRTRGGEFLGKVKAQLGLPMGSLLVCVCVCVCVVYGLCLS